MISDRYVYPRARFSEQSPDLADAIGKPEPSLGNLAFPPIGEANDNRTAGPGAVADTDATARLRHKMMVHDLRAQHLQALIASQRPLELKHILQSLFFDAMLDWELFKKKNREAVAPPEDLPPTNIPATPPVDPAMLAGGEGGANDSTGGGAEGGSGGGGGAAAG